MPLNMHRNYNSNIHLIGLVSDGSVHSHINHFKALVDYFARLNFQNELYFTLLQMGGIQLKFFIKIFSRTR
jgi:2,3-bisphosphoglycerate-independent phosphoglycerate mutase